MYYAGAVKAGLVQPQGTVFTNSISQLRKEVSLLYRILLGAKDYQTFLKTAAWARVHVNEGQFVKVCRSYKKRRYFILPLILHMYSIKSFSCSSNRP